MVLANIFQPLIDTFGPVLVFFHSMIGGSWGWSIIALTVVVRALLLPLALKQMHSMQELQQAAPQMKSKSTPPPLVRARAHGARRARRLRHARRGSAQDARR